jgi:aquaporin Z
MKKYVAELVGTAALCFIGCGAIVLGGYPSAFPMGILPIALAFGLTVTAMAYAIGPISGCHVNPAVSIAMVIAGRMPVSDLAGYIIAQVVGAFVGCGFLALILTAKAGGYDIQAAGLGQTTYDAAHGFGGFGAFVAELVGTFLFLVVILGATQKKSATANAGLVIGLALAILHLALVPVSGNSLNPARSLAPAFYVRGDALTQLWLYIVAPVAGAAIAAALFKAKLLSED